MTPRRIVVLALASATLAVALALVLFVFQGTPPPGPSDARALYERDCAICHGPQGKGDGPGARVVGQTIRDFTDGAAMSQVSDSFLFAIIQKGGSQLGRSNAMPAWGMKLSGAEIRALVRYIRSLAR